MSTTHENKEKRELGNRIPMQKQKPTKHLCDFTAQPEYAQLTQLTHISHTGHTAREQTKSTKPWPNQHRFSRHNQPPNELAIDDVRRKQIPPSGPSAEQPPAKTTHQPIHSTQPTRSLSNHAFTSDIVCAFAR